MEALPFQPSRSTGLPNQSIDWSFIPSRSTDISNPVDRLTFPTQSIDWRFHASRSAGISNTADRLVHQNQGESKKVEAGDRVYEHVYFFTVKDALHIWLSRGEICTPSL